jgi:hypothetical protein
VCERSRTRGARQPTPAVLLVLLDLDSAELFVLVVEVKAMDLDPATKEEERQLEDHNEAMDARQALMGFGVTHLDPIELKDFAGSRTGTSTDSMSPPASTIASAGGGSRKRSKVWNNFDELTNLVNGKRVRYAARCKYCHETLSARSSSSTGHLLRHNFSATKVHDRSSQTQYVLKYNPDGSLQHW